MTALLAAVFLVAGAALCLVAAVGVLRLPDFFMRLHAATKAGVAGCGLLLIGVAFAAPSPDMWIKVAVAIAFLLLTTPIAGHLLGRAGYVAGVPLWGRTVQDQLEGTLPRGQFESPIAGQAHQGASNVVVVLAGGAHAQETIRHAVALARIHRVPLLGLAIAGTGVSGEQASQLPEDMVRFFESTARKAAVPFSLSMEEGDPVAIIKARQERRNLMLVGRDGWLDDGVSGGGADPLAYLVREGISPLIGVAESPQDVQTVTFIHDGSPRSDDTLHWLLDTDPWPGAALRLLPDATTRPEEIGAAREMAAGKVRLMDDTEGVPTIEAMSGQVLIFGNGGPEGSTDRDRAPSRPPYDHVPIVVFG